jgi:DNA-binding transcriptional MocR family regulator
MSTDKKKKIVKPVTLSEQAYAIIKDEIITNQIKPGDLLTEEQLSERLSISRTPIRSALKQLVMEHLAEVNENKIVTSGYFQCSGGSLQSGTSCRFFVRGKDWNETDQGIKQNHEKIDAGQKSSGFSGCRV